MGLRWTGVILAIAVLILTGVYYYQRMEKTPLTASDAVASIKSEYPQYADYPSDGLPPRSIRTEQGDDGWYVAFVQEGSGRPLIDAHCFFVSEKGETKSIGRFTPGPNDNPEFSLETCKGL